MPSQKLLQPHLDTMAAVIAILLPIIMSMTCVTAVNPNPDISDQPVYPEYCEAESFTASCSPNHVIIIKHALYGRMRAGRCVTRNYGYLGCFANVLPHLDWMCSGKQSCEIRIPDQALDAVKPCPADLKTYLEAAYECIEVVTPPCEDCAPGGVVNDSAVLTGPGGHLAIAVLSGGVCATGPCQWTIAEQQGRRINMTLYDFSVPEGSGAGASPRMPCNSLATIQEIGGTPGEQTVELCSGAARESHVYTSQTSSVQVIIDSSFLRTDLTHQRRFIISYTAFGCADMPVPPHAWTRREGDSLVVGCDSTDTTYHLTCDGARWTGTMGSCPLTVATDKGTQVSNSHSQPVGIMIATAVGIALIIGSLVLTIGLLCFSRRSQRPRRQPLPPCYSLPPLPDPRLVAVSKLGSYCNPGCQKACYQAILASKHCPSDYEYAMELRPLPEAPEHDPYGVHGCTRVGGGSMAGYSRQTSCTPSDVNYDIAARAGSTHSEYTYRLEGGRPPRVCRHYFELEPESLSIVHVNAVANNVSMKPKVKVTTPKVKVTTEERQNKTNRGKEFTRQGSYHGSPLTSFGKTRSPDSASEELIEPEHAESSSKFSWP